MLSVVYNVGARGEYKHTQKLPVCLFVCVCVLTRVAQITFLYNEIVHECTEEYKKKQKKTAQITAAHTALYS